MPAPHGFAHIQRPDGSVVITHHDRAVTTLRSGRAERFLAEVAVADPQQVMARWTGNYKRGNERTSREHPRNRRR